MIDKRDRSAVFRDRLGQAMARDGVSKSELARRTGVDRSTIGQLLLSDMPRLPNAGLIAEAAQVLGVSADWLLGLSEHPERAGDLVEAAVKLTEAERQSVDNEILEWHRAAAGFKIRHVPATLPDMLKTEAVKAWEYAHFLGHAPDPATASTEDERAWLLSGASDYEIALPLHELTAFAEGSGYYRGLPKRAREEQLAYLATHCAELFPQLRLFLFDVKRAFSAPLTCFGPQRGVIYIGRYYLAFREGERVRALIRHFDWLVREATVDAREASAFITGLREAM